MHSTLEANWDVRVVKVRRETRFYVIMLLRNSELGKVQLPKALYIQFKGKAVPLQAWSGPQGSSKLRFPDFMTTGQDSGKVVSLTHRPPLPPGNTPGTHFCQRMNRPQAHSAIGRIMSMKNSSDTIGNRNRNLSVCSVVP